jgi:hypothetical protein
MTDKYTKYSLAVLIIAWVILLIKNSGLINWRTTFAIVALIALSFLLPQFIFIVSIPILLLVWFKYQSEVFEYFNRLGGK